MTADERIKMLLGELQVQNAILQSQVETLTAENEELKRAEMKAAARKPKDGPA